MGVSASRDLEQYRAGYPDQIDNPRAKKNSQFYKGKIKSKPRGALIDDIHKEWWGDYRLLEAHHGYIQWIFPIRESGMNHLSQPLQLHEAEVIKADAKCMERVLTSYKMMLDFYGMKLIDEHTGTLMRSENWRDRYHNLNTSGHNYLRITRILKCLGELGYEHLKPGFLEFVMEEVFENGQLRRTRNSLRNYWGPTLRNDDDRERLLSKIEAYENIQEDSKEDRYRQRRLKRSKENTEEKEEEKEGSQKQEQSDQIQEEKEEEEKESQDEETEEMNSEEVQETIEETNSKQTK